ncbi:hypothetical protein [Asticcacaulis sp. AC402]|uniref:hypothetical protein n=1 Tax=Asticcacaulis sp. AC402 TaxID=1282361 RepID=UPI0003C3FDD4|nr:hypothetical protein [Asticcacaulis sp. AC402]ESQ74679.1 hypothetical protein ABAC402_13050 [Asticcacaulis sp. AC402]
MDFDPNGDNQSLNRVSDNDSALGPENPSRNTIPAIDTLQQGPSTDFENVELDTVDGIDTSGKSDEISKLVGYLQNVSYASYQRQDFDDRLDAAKGSLQALNYRKDEGLGYLKDEAELLAVHYDRIPRFISILAFVLALVVTTGAFVWYLVSRTHLHDALIYAAGIKDPFVAYPNAINFVFLAGVSIGIASLCLGLGYLISWFRWWRDFEYRNSGNNRAKDIRLRNHDVLSNRIKNLQQVANERARNKDPDRGASGLLRVYLLFICGYVLHKTLNRCHTRFQQDFDQIWVPSVKARIEQLKWLCVVAAIAWAMVVAYKLLNPATDVTILFSLAAILLLPLALAWFVQRSLFHRAIREKGNVVKKLAFLKAMYQTHIPGHLLAAFKETETERLRFDFPDIYQYNDVEEYAAWLHNTLGALKRHEDETRK